MNKKDKDALVYEFAGRVARVFDDLRSSHILFIMQQAYGDQEWEESHGIIKAVIEATKS